MRDRIDLRDQDRHPPSRLRDCGESIQNACRRIDPREPSPTDRTRAPPRYDSATLARAPVRSFWAGRPRQRTVAGLIRAMSRPERAFRFARKHDQRCVRSTAAIHDLRKSEHPRLVWLPVCCFGFRRCAGTGESRRFTPPESLRRTSARAMRALSSLHAVANIEPLTPPSPMLLAFGARSRALGPKAGTWT